jgi:hypothetical protein
MFKRLNAFLNAITFRLKHVLLKAFLKKKCSPDYGLVYLIFYRKEEFNF